jgi:hypothetical protein
MIARALPWIVAAVGWLLVVVGAFRLLDSGVTLTHQRSQAHVALERVRVLEHLVSTSLQGVKRDDIETILRRKYADRQIHQMNDGGLMVNGVELTFQGDVFSGVKDQW